MFDVPDFPLYFLLNQQVLSANPDDKVWPNPIPLIFRWIHSPKFHGRMIAEPPISLELTYPYQPALLSRIIFPFVQVGYVRFLPWRVSSGWFFWSMGIRCVSGWCILESIVVLVKKCQAKAPRSYPIRFHARHASHAHQQKENTQQRKNDKIFQ